MPLVARRLLVWGPVIALAAALIGYMLWPRAVPVDLVTASRGPLTVSIEEEGRTRIRDVYEVSAPIGGRLVRIELEAGDPVVANETLLAELQPLDPGFLDVRTDAELRAALRAAEAGLDLARANVERARAQLRFAVADLERIERLAQSGTVSKRRHEEADLALGTARAGLAEAEATADMRAHELERARTQLLSPVEAIGQRDACPCVPIRAPVSGRVLRVMHESETVVPSGTTLMEIGDPGDLEIVVDLLSADAVKVEPGQTVRLDNWGGDVTIEADVTRVEPFGFTKVSALGIEEQRVNVLARPRGPADALARLAHGFRVEAAIILWHGEDVLRVPLTALFRDGDAWALYAVEAGRATLRHVEIGRGNGLDVEILSGLEAGETVIVHPGAGVVPGIRVRARDLSD